MSAAGRNGENPVSSSRRSPTDRPAMGRPMARRRWLSGRQVAGTKPDINRPLLQPRNQLQPSRPPMTSSAPFGGTVPMYRDDMARRRLQQKGDFYCSGGYWMLRWHEDQIKIDGTFKRGWSRSVCIGPCAEPGALRRKRRIGWPGIITSPAWTRTIERRSQS